MPPGDVLRVTPADLTAHAGRVDAIAERVGTAARAGETVRLDSQAYGQLCSIVPVLLGVLQHVVDDAITTAAQSLHDTSTRLHILAHAYESTDRASQASLDRLRKPE